MLTAGGRRVGQLRMPVIPAGNLRKLLEDLHGLHRRAGWPSTRDMARDAEFTYGAVHDLFTKPRVKAPNHRVLLTVVERLASMSRGIDDVDRVLDDFDCKWRDAAEQPFDETTSDLRLMTETDPERLSRIAHLTPVTPTTVDTPEKFDELRATATDRTPHGRLETNVATPNVMDSEVTRAETEPSAGDEELLAFMDAWGLPAFEAAKTLLRLARDALRDQDDLAKRHLAVLYQRVYDEADRAYSLAFNATKGLDGSPEPQAAVGDFHRHYQAMVTWIGAGFEHAVLDADSFWYREWYASDARFMDELRRMAAHLGRSALRENLRAAGFNEGVRHELPTPRSRS
jgi:hypothetical protein